ncbi:MAG TPA: hypothetical protein VMC79_01420, partial [Rectinemataceae bacterium]|nr:hypothetical protein [Rectinemataceae bacterium]
GPGYRDLFGKRPASDLGLAADFQTALRRAARAELALRMASTPPEPLPGGGFDPRSWKPAFADRSAALRLIAPLDLGPSGAQTNLEPIRGRAATPSSRVEHSVELDLGLERKPAGPALVSCGLGQRSQASGPDCRWSRLFRLDLRPCATGSPSEGSLLLSLESSCRWPGRGDGVSVDIEAGIETLPPLSSGSSCSLSGSCSLWLPLGAGGAAAGAAMGGSSAAELGLELALSPVTLDLPDDRERASSAHRLLPALTISYRSRLGR